MSHGSDQPLSSKLFNATVLVASLGYMVDMFDFFLYNMNRVKSLTDLGLSGDALTSAGIIVSNWQQGGFLVGAILWGILADKFGRKFALFPSILVYSIGSLACAFITHVEWYGPLRFLTAVGLAGELGTGMTLIVETMQSNKRGHGAMLFMGSGLVGVVLAGLCSEDISWRTSYLIGGIAGLLLLFARASLAESGLFKTSLNQKVVRGSFMPILKHPKMLWQYICGILLLVPGSFVPQIILTLSPEIAKAMQVTEPVRANVVLGGAYGFGILGYIFGAKLTEQFGSRKNAVFLFWFLSVICFVVFMILRPQNLYVFYGMCILLGMVSPIWALGALWGTEQFGTNIRATVSSTTPNFSRAMVIVMNLSLVALKPLGMLNAISIIGAAIFTISLIGWLGLRETYGKDLNYVD